MTELGYEDCIQSSYSSRGSSDNVSSLDGQDRKNKDCFSDNLKEVGPKINFQSTKLRVMK